MTNGGATGESEDESAGPSGDVPVGASGDASVGASGDESVGRSGDAARDGSDDAATSVHRRPAPSGSAGRYRGVVAGALALLTAGAVTATPWMVALAGVPLAFAAFGAVSGVPDPAVAVERRVEPQHPIPGDRVTVELTVENRTASPLPDVRIFDGVPDAVDVEGHATAATAIPPEGSVTLEYAFTAVRGEHAFDPPVLRFRGAAADGARDVRPEVTGDERVAARVFVEEPPSTAETATLVGATTSDAGGSGVEFHTVREYRPGDPLNRIDWHRLGRDGELATVNYREQRGRTVVVVADYRPGVRFGRVGDRCLYAADRMLQAIRRAGAPAGLAALGPAVEPWVAPGATDALARGRLALRAVDDRADWNGPTLRVDADARTVAEALADRLPVGAEVVVVTPATDDLALDLHEELGVRGHAVTVVSPRLVDPDTLGQRLVVAERRAQVERLRTAGVRLIDWDRADPLPVAVAESEVRARP